MRWCRRTALALALLAPATAHAGEDDLTLDLGEKVGLDLRRIPKGTFVQGSPATELTRDPDETVRTVTVSKAFWLGRTPVTRAQFGRFVTETRHVTDAEKGLTGGLGWDAKTTALVQKKDATWRNPGFLQKDEDPVVLVTYGDATAFAAWAARKTSRRVRLPTEAEWEYAARAGTTTAWYGATKEEDALALGWFKWNAVNSTHPVGTKKPNAWGLFDMSGNVYQWCRDVSAAYPPAAVTDPEATTNGGVEAERRILRGGSWLREPKRGRSAARFRSAPGTRSAEIGFRVAVDDEPEAPREGAPPVASALAAVDAGAPVAVPMPTRTPMESGPTWMLVVAPLGAAGVASMWVSLRRRRRTRPEPRPAPRAPSIPPRRIPLPFPVESEPKVIVSEPVLPVARPSGPPPLGGPPSGPQLPDVPIDATPLSLPPRAPSSAHVSVGQPVSVSLPISESVEAAPDSLPPAPSKAPDPEGPPTPRVFEPEGPPSKP